MEIFLTKQCQALTGSLGKGYGYHIQRRKNGFFAKRNSNGEIPADGHLRFIFACADLAQLKTHIADIRVSRGELREALLEAYPDDHCALLSHHCDNLPDNLPDFLSATDIIYLHRLYLPNQA